MKPSTVTTSKIRRLQKHLLEEPRRFNLEFWGCHIEPNEEVEIEINQVGEYADEDAINAIYNQEPPCGTVACLAGNICIMAGLIKPEEFKGVPIYEFQPDTPKMAAEWLGISRTDWGKLFYLESWSYYVEDDDGIKKRVGWPKSFEVELSKFQPGTLEYAQVAVNRLEYYLETGE